MKLEDKAFYSTFLCFSYDAHKCKPTTKDANQLLAHPAEQSEQNSINVVSVLEDHDPVLFEDPVTPMLHADSPGAPDSDNDTAGEDLSAFDIKGEIGHIEEAFVNDSHVDAAVAEMLDSVESPSKKLRLDNITDVNLSPLPSTSTVEKDQGVNIATVKQEKGKYFAVITYKCLLK